MVGSFTARQQLFKGQIEVRSSAVAHVSASSCCGQWSLLIRSFEPEGYSGTDNQYCQSIK